jgi:uncharacterized FlgJ-related protein
MKNFLLILLFLFSGFTFKSTTKVIKTDSVEFLKKSETISLKDSVYNFIIKLNIKHSDIVFAQSILESGHLESKIFKSNNNLFGMKHPKIRATVSLGSKNGHAYYENWKMSIIDYALWQASFARKKNEKEFYKYLKNVYAKDSLYIDKIKKIVNGIRK